MRIAFIFIVAIYQFSFKALAQDSLDVNVMTLFHASLNGDLNGAVEMARSFQHANVKKKYARVINEYLRRFAFAADSSDYLVKHTSAADSLLKIYHHYWRSSLLNPGQNFSKLLKRELVAFYRIDTLDLVGDYSIDDLIDSAQRSYITQLGYYTNGFARTGQLYDLLLWRQQKDSLYHFMIHGDSLDVPVVFLQDFIVNGWQEYATANYVFSGGWAGKDSLYCVTKMFQLESERFRSAFLMHEGRHLKDYRIYPLLKGADLEYRAKLTELSVADQSLFSVLSTFLSMADGNSGDPHLKANYHVMVNLSGLIFGKPALEKDVEAWNRITKTKIHDAAIALLRANDDHLTNGNRCYICP